ncbi:MAG: DUF3761 domain-containing protein [Gemmatimonadaceae bacterium]
MIRFIESRAFRATFVLLASVVVSSVVLAQPPAGAPAGAMGLCKDGTYSMDKTKSGACSGHKGVKTWYAAKAASKPTTATTTAPATAMAAPVVKPAKTSVAPVTAAPAMAPAVKPASSPKPSLASKTAAPGGGPGLVWVNTESKVYHCQSSKYYGKTKKGEYMTEAAAKTAGSHADHGKACS